MQKKQVKLNCYSQPHVLRHYMLQAGLIHGDIVTADIQRVRIDMNEHDLLGQPYMYFCPSNGVEIKKFHERGDGLPMPENVVLKEVAIPTNLPIGLYNLKNVTLYSNGSIQVIATNETVFEPCEHLLCTLPFSLPF